MLDVGKDFTKIVQSIGRSLRKDGVYNEVEIIDISSKTLYADRHRDQRRKTYEQNGYDFSQDVNIIKIPDKVKEV